VVIGATGHVGTYLIPRLVALGHEVAAISRRQREPYLPHPAWSKVASIALDAEEPGMAAKVADLKPDAVIDMICFTESRARALVEALRGVKHFLSCGTIWVHGHSTVVPATEDLPRRPFGSYGLQKAAIETYLLEEHRRSGFPATVLHPGHIVGTGHVPVNPAATRTGGLRETGRAARSSRSQPRPRDPPPRPRRRRRPGLRARAREAGASVGESFHVVSPAAVTLRGFAEAVAEWFGKPPRSDSSRSTSGSAASFPRTPS
jgi:nucleoside-diphosphate-sugar epimerase